MKLLHTADWHLCDRLGKFDRTHDLRTRVETVARHCDEHAVDVLLVAGDLFYENAKVEEIAAELLHIHSVFGPFFVRGGTILAITGNHDDDRKIEAVRAGMALAVPTGSAGPLRPGRMYLQNGRAFVTIEAGGTQAQFALAPYPTRSRYGEPGDVFRSAEEENRVNQGRVAEWLRDVKGFEKFDPTLPTVLVGHFSVAGADLSTRYKITERDDVVMPDGFLPAAWAYIALGHIHKPQAVGGRPHVRYPGPLDRLDFGEKDNPCGVVLFELDKSGLRGEPKWLPLEPTPFLEIELTDPESELLTLVERFPDRASAFVKVTVHRTATGSSRDEIDRALRTTFPRLFEVKWDEPESAASAASGTYFPRKDYAETVRSYLQDRLADDPDRDAVLELAESFLVRRAEA